MSICRCVYLSGLSMYLSVCLSICLPFCRCLSVRPSVYLSVSVYLLVCVYLSVYLPVCVCLSVCLPVSICLCLSCSVANTNTSACRPCIQWQLVQYFFPNVNKSTKTTGVSGTNRVFVCWRLGRHSSMMIGLV